MVRWDRGVEVSEVLENAKHLVTAPYKWKGREWRQCQGYKENNRWEWARLGVHMKQWRPGRILGLWPREQKTAMQKMSGDGGTDGRWKVSVDGKERGHRVEPREARTTHCAVVWTDTEVWPVQWMAAVTGHAGCIKLGHQGSVEPGCLLGWLPRPVWAGEEADAQAGLKAVEPVGLG